MKDFDHLMSVWQGQPKQEQLSVEETLKQVKKGCTQHHQSAILGNSSYGGYAGAYIYYHHFLCVPVVNLRGAVHYVVNYDGLCRPHRP